MVVQAMKQETLLYQSFPTAHTPEKALTHVHTATVALRQNFTTAIFS